MRRVSAAASRLRCIGRLPCFLRRRQPPPPASKYPALETRLLPLPSSSLHLGLLRLIPRQVRRHIACDLEIDWQRPPRRGQATPLHWTGRQGRRRVLGLLVPLADGIQHLLQRTPSGRPRRRHGGRADDEARQGKGGRTVVNLERRTADVLAEEWTGGAWLRVNPDPNSSRRRVEGGKEGLPRRRSDDSHSNQEAGGRRTAAFGSPRPRKHDLQQTRTTARPLIRRLHGRRKPGRTRGA